MGDIGLHDEEDNSGPENDVKGVNNRVGFQTRPAFEEGEVLSNDLVEDEYNGFGALCFAWMLANSRFSSLECSFVGKSHHANCDCACSCPWLVLEEYRGC